MKKNILYLVIVTIFSINQIHCFGDKTIFGIRSQGLNAARELTGWQQIIYKFDQGSNYGTLAATAEYTRSFHPQDIANFLFNDTCLRFSGSRAEREEGDILADYFGLPSDFVSGVSFSPYISNFIMDFNWFQAFDKYVPGLFIMLHVPIVHTKWNLHSREIVLNPGTNSYPAGYMSNTQIAASSLPHSVTQALQGNTTFGDMDEPLRYGKVFGRQTMSRIAELQGTLGWNYNQPWYHAGVSLRIGAPTGNPTKSEFLFESIVGNRHHWDVGFGFSGHVLVWQHKDAGRRLGLYFDSHIGHLSTTQQKRSFDFINNGNGSRYILLEQIESPSQNLLINDRIAPNQYIGNLVPAINYTTLDTEISIGVQAEMLLKLAYQRDGFEFDFGYNFWANSKEKLHCREMFIENKFAIKGDAQLYGFTSDNSAVAVNATQNDATILSGQGNGNNNFSNQNADNQPALAASADGAGLRQLNLEDAFGLSIDKMQIQGSNPAILLTDNDINEESGLLPRAFSHKLFAYAGCLWNNRDDIDPYLGVGLSGEFANTNPCNNATTSQWAIWVKGGLSY